MIGRIIGLRNRIHKNKFRFELTPEHWKVLYVPEDVEQSNLATVVRNKRLRGYAAYYLINFEQNRAYDVREICAEDQDTLTELVDQIVKKSVEDGVDFIFLKRCEEPHRNVFARKGFLSFSDSVVMGALLNPEELLLALSTQIKNGKVLNLIIGSFAPFKVRVGDEGIMVVKEEKSDLTVSTDEKTFLKLFFGKTSFLKEFLRKRIVISNVLQWTIVSRFFKVVKQDKWYIPIGDWV
ncbi:MAG: hypothetical protein JSV85_07225 [Candidatus Bathyarchaeota archaeon]|nr:MAG: hypothetical protein JSV85_07225 [Candidatus Bathyarchaeota archaeon]